MTLDFANHPLRYRYEIRGRVVWLTFDPALPCFYCNEPVGVLSTGGPAFCGQCACGNYPVGDGRREKYGFASQINAEAHAIQKFLSLPHDPAWQEYEAVYRNSEWLKQHCSCVGGGLPLGC